MFEVKNIAKSYKDFTLKPVDLLINEGDYFVLLGVSGVGKSVLLDLLAGLRKPDNGGIFLRNKDLSKVSLQKREIGLVYQGNNLFPHMSVKQNIEFPLKCKKFSKDLREEKINKFLKFVEADNLLNRDVNTLSGGEAQRISLARTLASEPEILLLDEPLSSLDSKSRSELRTLLRKINREGQTIIHVTHDFEEAISLASTIAVMEDGKIIQVGKPDEIFNNPKSEFVANFAGIKNFIKGRLELSESSEIKNFITENVIIKVLSESEPGECYLMIPMESVTISNLESSDSAQNNFNGIVKDIALSKSGVEVSVDIGFNIISLITKESLEKLKIEIGSKVFVKFKATSCKIYNI